MLNCDMIIASRGIILQHYLGFHLRNIHHHLAPQLDFVRASQCTGQDHRAKIALATGLILAGIYLVAKSISHILSYCSLWTEHQSQILVICTQGKTSWRNPAHSHPRTNAFGEGQLACIGSISTRQEPGFVLRICRSTILGHLCRRPALRINVEPPELGMEGFCLIFGHVGTLETALDELVYRQTQQLSSRLVWCKDRR